MDAKALGRVLQRLAFDEHRPQHFITTLLNIRGLKKVVLVSRPLHGRLRAKLSSNYLPDWPFEDSSSIMELRAKTA